MPLLDSTSVVSPSSFALGPVVPRDEVALISASGITLLHLPQLSPASIDGALKSLRGFRAGGRRVAWLNLAEASRSPQAELRGWGEKLVAMGGAEMLVVSGPGGRDVAVAARDAGLPLSRVIVCRDDAIARNVLCDSLSPDDVVLAVGMPADSCHRLSERLESRFERELQPA